jgi:hypothetical protein
LVTNDNPESVTSATNSRGGNRSAITHQQSPVGPPNYRHGRYAIELGLAENLDELWSTHVSSLEDAFVTAATGP